MQKKQIEILDIVIYKDEEYFVRQVLRKEKKRKQDEFALINLNNYMIVGWIKEDEIEKSDMGSISDKRLLRILKIIKLIDNAKGI
jgi:hypothetical protein